MKKNILLATTALTIFASCKKETPTYDSNIKADLSVEFDNVVGSSDMQLNTATYTNAVGENFKISTFKYFVSNFVLTKSDGTTYTVPQDECYFLIDESNASSHDADLKIPEGEYKTLSFTVGVDSLRNTMDITKRTGNLDPAGIAAGMYWTWNSGYIFLKMEGTSNSSTQAGNIFQYHIGLFGGYTSPTINNIKNVTLDLSTRGVAQVKSGKNTNIHLMVDALKVFNGTTNVSLASNAVVMASPFSATVANNYKSMFSHEHTEN